MGTVCCGVMNHPPPLPDMQGWSPPPVMKYVLFLWAGLLGVATGAFTVVLSSSVGSDFIDAHPPAGPLFCIKDVPFTPALLSP